MKEIRMETTHLTEKEAEKACTNLFGRIDRCFFRDVNSRREAYPPGLERVPKKERLKLMNLIYLSVAGMRSEVIIRYYALLNELEEGEIKVEEK